MKDLSPALTAAQQAAARVPYLKIEAHNRRNGVLQLDWERLYTGSEADYYHALAVSGSGSLVRARLTPPADGRKLYRQTVPAPGPGADFSSWTYTNQYNCTRVAAAARGSTVSIFWMNTGREIRRIVSNDYGVSWSGPELIDQSPTTAAGGLAAAYKANGDLALFFADQATLYVKKQVNGSWQSRSTWDKTTGNISGVSVVYDLDWYLLITGQDAAGSPKIWSLVYGDGGTVPAGTWSPLCTAATAPAGGEYSYDCPALFMPDRCRGFFMEKYEGTLPYNRLYQSHTVPETEYQEGLWREPGPGDFPTPYGLAAGYQAPGEYAWLAAPNGVWRALLLLQTVDISRDVLALEMSTGEQQGRLTVELDNRDNRYKDFTGLIGAGSQLEITSGYRTQAGNQSGSHRSFLIDYHEHIINDAGNVIRLQAGDGWTQLKEWRSREQWRWNKAGQEKSIRDILAFVLSRAGLRLAARTESAAVNGFYPDFTIHPLDSGDQVVAHLLALVPDRIIMENGTAYLVYPQAADEPGYSYGTAHPILEGKYLRQTGACNWVRVEGYDPAAGGDITADFFNWPDLKTSGSHYLAVNDVNLASPAQLAQRGEMLLRNAGMKTAAGLLVVPANCGQELYDVVEITDARGFSGSLRVSGMELIYEPARGRYLQRLTLSGV